MKRMTRTIALLCALALLAALAGCGKDPTPTPNPTPTPDPTPTPEYEMIAVTMPEQQPGEATEKIIKAVNDISGVWALSEDRNLYRIQLENNEPDMSTMEVAYQNVQDFTLGSYGEDIDSLAIGAARKSLHILVRHLERAHIRLVGFELDAVQVAILA